MLSEVMASPKLNTFDVLGFIQFENLPQLGYAFGLSYDFIERSVNETSLLLSGKKHRQAKHGNGL